MNKHVKTLNNKKIKYKIFKNNFIAHIRVLSHKGLNLTTNQQSKNASYNKKHKAEIYTYTHHVSICQHPSKLLKSR